MACDSHNTKPSSLIVGTRPFGFIVLYSGVLLTPNFMPASIRSKGSASSAQHHNTFCTLMELQRPQIFSMVRVPLVAGELQPVWCHLFSGDAAFSNDLAPLVRLAFEPRPELLGRAADDFIALLGEAFACVLLSHRLA